MVKTADGISAVRVNARETSKSVLWVFAVIPIVAIPVENQYTILGFSIAKLTMVPLAVGVLTFRFSMLLSVLKHKVFLFGMAFLGWSALCESFHPYADLEVVYRMLQVFAFAALLAVVASDGLSLKRILLAIAGVCSLVSLYLVVNFYGAVSVDIDTVREAGRVRSAAFEGMSLKENLNILGYTAGMGAIIALPQFLLATKPFRRTLWASVYVMCFLGALTPLSRGAMLAVLAGSGLVLWRSFSKSIKPSKVFLILGVAVLLFMLTPEALTTRFSTIRPSETTMASKPDSRAGVLTAALDSMPEYWRLGVGSGQYWTTWAARNGFLSSSLIGKGGVLGPHNGFFAAWIYFGLPGLILLCLVCFSAARACPKRSNSRWEASAIFGLAILGLIWLVFTHNLYLKAFGIILGLLMATPWKRIGRHLNPASVAIRSRQPGGLRRPVVVKPGVLAGARSRWR